MARMSKSRASAPTPPMALRNLAFEGFCRQIHDARLRPGQFVSQRELVELLQMPLAAVRELIPRLEAAGLIRTAPKRGLQITPVDLKLIRNAWQVRAMVEREAVQHYSRHAAPEVIERLIAEHEAILARALSAQPDARLEKDARKVDWSLHDTLVDALGNELLSEIYRVNSLHVRLIGFDADAIRTVNVVPSMREHLEVLRALAARDTEGAQQHMLAHLEASRRRVLDVMMQTGQADAPARARG